MTFWNAFGLGKKEPITSAAPASFVDTSLPKTQTDIRIDLNLDRLKRVHDDFTKVLEDITKDQIDRMGGRS